MRAGNHGSRMQDNKSKIYFSRASYSKGYFTAEQFYFSEILHVIHVKKRKWPCIQLLRNRKLNIYFVVSLFDFCSFRLVTLDLKSCYDLADKFKRSSHTKGFCCRVVLFPTCL